MDNFFLYGGGQTPDIIMGKYSSQGLNPEIAQTYGETEALQLLSEIKVNKYELWFSDTINFIPYDGSPVFIVDSVGNLINKGNISTAGSLTVQKTLTAKENSTFEKDLNIKNNLSVSKDVTVDGELEIVGNIRIGGTITATNITAIQKAVDSLGDLGKIIDDLKKTVDDLTKEIDKLKKSLDDKKTT
jgi:hypothetical protein